MTTGHCHVLVITYPGPPLHLVRALRFAKLLIERGCRITLLIPEDELRLWEGKLFPGWRDGIDVVEVMPPSEVEGGSKNGYNNNAAANLELSCLPYLEKQLEVKASGQAGGVSVMITDAFLAWTQGWANRLDIPRYVMMPTAADTLLMVELPHLISQGLLESGNDELISVEGLPVMHLSESYAWIKAGLTGGKNHPEFALGIGATMLQAEGILINTCYELEQLVFDTCCRKFASELSLSHVLASSRSSKQLFQQGLNGYAILSPTYLCDDSLVSGSTGSSHPCLQWLDSQPASSVLFAAFGSWSTLSNEQIRELVLGLESSGLPFLCCLPQSSRHPYFYIDGFETRVRDRGLVLTEWAPQRLILSHPATKGFLTHSGWNSILESICRGIPFIGMPEKANQGLICRLMVDYHKIGLELKKGPDGIAPKDEVRKKVLSLMVETEGQELKKRLELLRSKVEVSIREGGSAYQNIQHVLTLISGHVA